MEGFLPDIITCANFQCELFRGYDFTGSRIFHCPIDFCMGLYMPQCRATYCATCTKSAMQRENAYNRGHRSTLCDCKHTFLPRCMECRCGLTMRILSVRPSVCPSGCLINGCIVTKRKKNMSRFLYHTKEHLAQFSEKKNGWWRPPLLPKILGQPAPRWSEIDDFEPIFARSASAV